MGTTRAAVRAEAIVPRCGRLRGHRRHTGTGPLCCNAPPARWCAPRLVRALVRSLPTKATSIQSSQSPSSLDPYRSSRCSRVASTNHLPSPRIGSTGFGTRVPTMASARTRKGMKRGICTSCLRSVLGQGDAAQAACRRIPAATGWSDVGGAALEPAGRAIHRVAAIRSRAVLAGDTRCVAIRTLHGVAQGVGWHASIPRVRVGRNATAEWRHLCRDRPYGLQCAAHGRNTRRRRGNVGIGLRCGRTRTSNSR